MKTFGTVRQKISDKAVMSPHPMHEKFLYQKFLKCRWVPQDIFGTVGQNGSDGKGKIVIPSVLSITFFHTEIFLKHNGPAYEVFRFCETKRVSTNSIKPPPPLLCREIFTTRSFSKHRGVLIWVFSALRDNKNRRRNVIPSTLAILFSIQEHFLKQKSPPTSFSVLQKNSTKP